MPIYRTTITLGAETKDRLIEAPNEAFALRFAAKGHIKAEAIRTAEQIKEMAGLAANGVKVEHADTE